MPKRILKSNLDITAKIRRKSMLIDDNSHSDLEHEEKERMPVEKKEKNMTYVKSDQNNEIERLLLHNSKVLIYHVDHSDFPAFNVGIWPQQNEMLNTYPSVAFSVPRPISVAKKMCEKIDICYKRPMSYDFYKTRMKHTRTSYKTALKSNKNLRRSLKDKVYHSSVFDIAERIYLQPDPFFYSSYDLYFTGGNLCVFPHQGKIVHAGGDKLQEILVSEFPLLNEYNDDNSLRKIASHKTSENCEVFEVQPLIVSSDNTLKNYFIARQRNLITFNYINETDQIKTVTQFRSKSTPFISFAQSERDINNFCITTMKQHIRLYDLNSSVPVLEKLFEISPNSTNISWNTVKPWRENTFMYANEKQFFMVDTRTSPTQWSNKITFATDSFLCDHISAIQPSDFNNLFYIATNHKLQCMDVRNFKKYSLSDSEGAVCRWSHQLRYAPLMMDTFRLRQTEYIALSSPIAGDLHICQLSRERKETNISLESTLHTYKHIYSSPCLPYQPPTLLEVYENARLMGKCLRPESNLEARLKCCTTGMKFLNLSLKSLNCGIGLLLTLNSNGDVFAHTLSKREQNQTEERNNSESSEILAEFERKICEATQLDLKYTEIKNMKGLRKVFLCKVLSNETKFNFDAKDNEYNEDINVENNAINPTTKYRPNRLHLGRWQKSLSTLHSYKDALAADLLSIWDIDIEEEKNVRSCSFRHDVKTDPTIKVQDWLKQNINVNPPMLSIPLQEISRFREIDAAYSSTSATNINLTQNEIDFENAIHSTQIFDNSVNTSNNFDTSDVVIKVSKDTATPMVQKLKNKKKQFIKGF